MRIQALAGLTALLALTACDDSATPVFTAGGNTVGGPSYFKREIPEHPGLALAKAFDATRFQEDVGFDICLTINNFQGPSLDVKTLVVGGSTIQDQVLSYNSDVLCYQAARRTIIQCPRDQAGRTCEFSWRVDSLQGDQ
jgi:hypothetical protein